MSCQPREHSGPQGDLCPFPGESLALSSCSAETVDQELPPSCHGAECCVQLLHSPQELWCLLTRLSEE